MPLQQRVKRHDLFATWDDIVVLSTEDRAVLWRTRYLGPSSPLEPVAMMTLTRSLWHSADISSGGD